MTTIEGRYHALGKHQKLRELFYRCTRSTPTTSANLVGGGKAATWECQVWLADEDLAATGQGYSAEFIETGIRQVVSANMSVDRAKFSAIGVPEGLIAAFSAHTGADVYSATDSGTPIINPDRRSPKATKVWKRLCERHWAGYDAAADRYHFPNFR